MIFYVDCFTIASWHLLGKSYLLNFSRASLLVSTFHALSRCLQIFLLQVFIQTLIIHSDFQKMFLFNFRSRDYHDITGLVDVWWSGRIHGRMDECHRVSQVRRNNHFLDLRLDFTCWCCYNFVSANIGFKWKRNQNNQTISLLKERTMTTLSPLFVHIYYYLF